MDCHRICDVVCHICDVYCRRVCDVYCHMICEMDFHIICEVYCRLYWECDLFCNVDNSKNAMDCAFLKVACKGGNSS